MLFRTAELKSSFGISASMRLYIYRLIYYFKIIQSKIPTLISYEFIWIIPYFLCVNQKTQYTNLNYNGKKWLSQQQIF